MDRHFAIVVPERALLCPVLRYAVYTASAGHLIRLAYCRGGNGNIVSVDGTGLPNLTPDAAIRYHDICISHLIEISKDPNEEYNEDVLTAATILRFYEQIDGTYIPMHSSTTLMLVSSPVHWTFRGIFKCNPVHCQHPKRRIVLLLPNH